MYPLKKFLKFFINILGQKTKLNKIPSLNKVSQKASPSIWIKVDHKQQTAITSFFEQTFDPVTQYPPTVITVGKECILDLEPGYVLDACAYMSFEDFSEIKKYGKDIIKKLKNKPIYVLDTTKKEYRRKKCPKDRFEIVRKVEYTGKPRNFNNTLAELLKSLGVDIYYVEVESSSELRRKANECLTKFREFGLHKPDDMYLAFAHASKSDILTLDCPLMESSKKAGVKSINFQSVLDQIMKKSPMRIIVEERKKLPARVAKLKNKKSVPVILFGNQNSFKPGILKEWGRLEIPTLRRRKK